MKDKRHIIVPVIANDRNDRLEIILMDCVTENTDALKNVELLHVARCKLARYELQL